MKEALSTPAFGVDEYPRRDKKKWRRLCFKDDTCWQASGRSQRNERPPDDDETPPHSRNVRHDCKRIRSYYERQNKFYDTTLGDVIGNHGVGKLNSDGLLFLQICAEQSLLITNTVLCIPTGNETSGMHPR